MLGCVLWMLTCVGWTLADPCPPSTWFEAWHQQCLPCSTCDQDQLELWACAALRDTVCANLDSSGTTGGAAQDASGAWSGGASVAVWTASEQVDGNSSSVALRPGSMVPPPSKSPLEHEASWNTTGLVVLGLLIAAVVTVATLLLVRRLRHWDRRHRKTDSATACNRARLFSRDRLDTTEYMHSLATLDRKLAMDEILEKRRRAIFAQDMEGERKNNYTDEVFLEVSNLTADEAETEDGRREEFR